MNKYEYPIIVGHNDGIRYFSPCKTSISSNVGANRVLAIWNSGDTSYCVEYNGMYVYVVAIIHRDSGCNALYSKKIMNATSVSKASICSSDSGILAIVDGNYFYFTKNGIEVCSGYIDATAYVACYGLYGEFVITGLAIGSAVYRFGDSGATMLYFTDRSIKKIIPYSGGYIGVSLSDSASVIIFSSDLGVSYVRSVGVQISSLAITISGAIIAYVDNGNSIYKFKPEDGSLAYLGTLNYESNISSFTSGSTVNVQTPIQVEVGDQVTISDASIGNGDYSVTNVISNTSFVVAPSITANASPGGVFSVKNGIGALAGFDVDRYGRTVVLDSINNVMWFGYPESMAKYSLGLTGVVGGYGMCGSVKRYYKEQAAGYGVWGLIGDVVGKINSDMSINVGTMPYDGYKGTVHGEPFTEYSYVFSGTTIVSISQDGVVASSRATSFEILSVSVGDDGVHVLGDGIVEILGYSDLSLKKTVNFIESTGQDDSFYFSSISETNKITFPFVIAGKILQGSYVYIYAAANGANNGKYLVESVSSKYIIVQGVLLSESAGGFVKSRSSLSSVDLFVAATNTIVMANKVNLRIGSKISVVNSMLNNGIYTVSSKTDDYRYVLTGGSLSDERSSLSAIYLSGSTIISCARGGNFFVVHDDGYIEIYNSFGGLVNGFQLEFTEGVNTSKLTVGSSVMSSGGVVLFVKGGSNAAVAEVPPFAYVDKTGLNVVFPAKAVPYNSEFIPSGYVGEDGVVRCAYNDGGDIKLSKFSLSGEESAGFVVDVDSVSSVYMGAYEDASLVCKKGSGTKILIVPGGVDHALENIIEVKMPDDVDFNGALSSGIGKVNIGGGDVLVERNASVWSKNNTPCWCGYDVASSSVVVSVAGNMVGGNVVGLDITAKVCFLDGTESALITLSEGSNGSYFGKIPLSSKPPMCVVMFYILDRFTGMKSTKSVALASSVV